MQPKVNIICPNSSASSSAIVSTDAMSIAWGTKVGKAQCDRLILERLQCDRRLQPTGGDAITVVELCTRFLRFADGSTAPVHEELPHEDPIVAGAMVSGNSNRGLSGSGSRIGVGVAPGNRPAR